MLRCMSPDVTICEVSPCAVDVRKVGYNGLDLLTLSSSRFDPQSKSVRTVPLGFSAAVSEAICSLSKPLINISHSSSGRNDLARIY
jgi:hypothetical protein